ncbi:MAG: twin-arginine translocase subunit TatC [Acidimicrobiales bacterium]
MVRALSRRSEERADPDSMTLFQHLAELRKRLAISLGTFAVGACITYGFYNEVLSFLVRPYRISCVGCSLVELAPLQGFTTRLNVCAYGGLVIGLPVILYQLWKFVTPGLKANEKRYALPFVVSSVVLFVLGGMTAYIIYPKGLGWLHQQAGTGITSEISIQSYIDLICILILIFGITFEFPIVLVGLEMAGAVRSATLRRVRRFSYMGIIVFAAVITPSSDPFSLCALAVPLIVFYEAAIVVGRALHK